MPASMDLHERGASMCKLVIAITLSIIFMIVEVIGGIKENLLFYVVVFMISLFSLWATGRESTPRQPYGFLRIEILQSLVSILMPWLLAGIMVYEVIVLLIHDNRIKGLLIFAMSVIGFVSNIIIAVLLGRGHSHRNINVQSAYLHKLGDSIPSIGVVIGGAIIRIKPKWKMIDMICTFVVLTTVKMLMNLIRMLMESTPRDIDMIQLKNGLCCMDGVVEIHDLHIWTISITMKKLLLTCHVTIAPDADSDRLLDQIIGYIKKDSNISHVTIEIKRQ